MLFFALVVSLLRGGASKLASGSLRTLGSSEASRTYAVGTGASQVEWCSTPIHLLRATGWRDVTKSIVTSNRTAPPRLLFRCTNHLKPFVGREPQHAATASDNLLLQRVKAAASRSMVATRGPSGAVRAPPTLVNSVTKAVGGTCLDKITSNRRWRSFAERTPGCSTPIIGVPQGFSLPSECNAWLAAVRVRSCNWIAKPGAGSFHGDGIVHVTRAAALARGAAFCGKPRLMEEYIEPSTINDGHKFDLRAFLLLTTSWRGGAAGGPSIAAWYHRGYARRADVKYDPNSTSRNVHVTNARSQSYSKVGANAKAARLNTLSFGAIGRALAREHGLAADHMRIVVPAQMRAQMRFAVGSLTYNGSTCPLFPAASYDAPSAEWRGRMPVADEALGGFYI